MNRRLTDSYLAWRAWKRSAWLREFDFGIAGWLALMALLVYGLITL
jgi:hypothetical protein